MDLVPVHLPVHPHYLPTKQAGRSLDDEAAVRSAAATAEWQIAAGPSLPQPCIAPLGSALASPPAAPPSASSPAATLRTVASARPVPGAQGAVSMGPAGAAAPPPLQSRSAPAAPAAGGSGVRPVAARAGSPDRRAAQPPSASPTSSVSQLHSGRCESMTYNLSLICSQLLRSSADTLCIRTALQRGWEQ